LPVKRLFWIASSKTDWNTFPASVNAEGGYQLDKVQRGEEPSDWKPMSNIGAGVREIRIAKPRVRFV
jgi:phage-related protein